MKAVTSRILTISLLIFCLAFGAGLAQADLPHVVISKDGNQISYETYGAGEPTLVFVLRNPFFLDSEFGFDWTVNPVFSGQWFSHFLPAVRVGIGCPVQSFFAMILRIESFVFMVMA